MVGDKYVVTLQHFIVPDGLDCVVIPADNIYRAERIMFKPFKDCNVFDLLAVHDVLSELVKGLNLPIDVRINWKKARRMEDHNNG